MNAIVVPPDVEGTYDLSRVNSTFAEASTPIPTNLMHVSVWAVRACIAGDELFGVYR